MENPVSGIWRTDYSPYQCYVATPILPILACTDETRLAQVTSSILATNPCHRYDPSNSANRGCRGGLQCCVELLPHRCCGPDGVRRTGRYSNIELGGRTRLRRRMSAVSAAGDAETEKVWSGRSGSRSAVSCISAERKMISILCRVSQAMG